MKVAPPTTQSHHHFHREIPGPYNGLASGRKTGNADTDFSLHEESDYLIDYCSYILGNCVKKIELNY